MDKSQCFNRNKFLTSGSDNKNFEKHLNQQAKRSKMKIKKATAISSQPQQLKMKLVSALNNVEKTDRTSKLSVMTEISRYLTILKKVPYRVTTLPPAQVTVKRLFFLFE